MMSVCKHACFILAVVLLLTIFLSGCAGKTAIYMGNSADTAFVPNADSLEITEDCKDVAEKEQYISETGNATETSVHVEMTEEERSIADIIVDTIYADIKVNLEYAEFPEVLSFESTYVNVEYIPGYIWFPSDKPDSELLKLAPGGITCFIKIPVSTGDQSKGYVIIIGQRSDGTFISDWVDRYTSEFASNMEEFLEGNLVEYKQTSGSIKSFEMYIPPYEVLDNDNGSVPKQTEDESSPNISLNGSEAITPGISLPIMLNGNAIVCISVNSCSNMVVMEDGSLWAWGANYAGQLGDSTTTNRLIPVKVMDDVTYVSAGGDHCMAVRSDSSLWGWGDNRYGQLGGGPYEFGGNPPIKVMDNVKSVAAGVSYTIALKSDNSLWAWGGEYGYAMIGDGATEGRLTPVHIIDSIVFASAEFHTMVIDTDARLWAWGQNWDGQIGDGTRTVYDFDDRLLVEDNEKVSPICIMDNVAAAAVGNNYSFAVRTDNSLWAWGNNLYGQLGDGTTTDQINPIKIMDGVKSVSAGCGHTMVIKTDGSLWGWGLNALGQLGDGTTIDRHTPVKIMDGVVSVATGSAHTIALKADGSLWAWGDNSSGQLGDGTTEQRLTPVEIFHHS